MPTKAERIHQQQRIKRLVSHYWNARPGDERSIGRIARTHKPCSCWMCGNPRRYDGDKVKDKAMKQRKLFEGWDG